jgi:hypothetical protein
MYWYSASRDFLALLGNLMPLHMTPGRCDAIQRALHHMHYEL